MWQFAMNSTVTQAPEHQHLWIWLPIYYACLLVFRLLIYCDVSEKNKILKQELTNLINKTMPG